MESKFLRLMRYANILYNDVQNTDGLSLTFYTQGCPHHCFGCFQPQTWDFNGGFELDEAKINEIEYCLRNYKYDYLCLLGGEPLTNLKESQFMIDLCKKYQPNIKVWCYTGFLFEEIKTIKILNDIDVLIDGKFEKENYDATLKWRGSSNQNFYIKENGIWKKEKI